LFNKEDEFNRGQKNSRIGISLIRINRNQKESTGIKKNQKESKGIKRNQQESKNINDFFLHKNRILKNLQFLKLLV
jgi:hypothetical protein